MGLTGRIWTAGGVMLVLLAVPAVAAPQPAAGETAEPVRELEADQQRAVAGEAPPTDTARPSAVKGGPKDAAEHLARVEEIVREALEAKRGDAPPEEEKPIGTAGTPLTAQTGEVVTIERAKLEEIQLHLEQIRTALDARPK